MAELERFTTYMPSPCDGVLHDLQRSAVVFGAPGSGRTFALDEMKRRLHTTVLFVPLQPVSFDTQGGGASHVALFSVIRAACAQRLVDLLDEQPDRINGLPDVCQEFLRWLLETSFPARSVRVWRKRIPQLNALFSTPYEDFYPACTPDSIRGQMDEILLFAGELGKTPIAFTFDAANSLSDEELKFVRALLGWRDFWQLPHLLLKAALPLALVAQSDLVDQARGRIEFHRMQWTIQDGMALATARIAQFRHEPNAGLDSVLEPLLLDGIVAMLEDILAEHTPYAWSKVGDILGQMAEGRKRVLTAAQDEVALRRAIYRKLAPIVIDANEPGVWRGARHLDLREQPRRILEQLGTVRGEETRAALLAVVGSEGNLHKQISELRKAIEPLPEGSREWVYICKGGDGNYVFNGEFAKREHRPAPGE